MSPITVAEALVLLDETRGRPLDVIRFTLLEMWGRKLLDFSEIGVVGDLDTEYTVAITALRDAADEPDHFVEAMDAVRFAARSGPVTIESFAREARRRWSGGPGLEKRFVRAALVRRGLLREETRKYFGFFERSVTAPTPAGVAEKARLASLRARIRDIPDLMDRDPSKAAVIAREAGAMLLPEQGTWRHFPELGIFDPARSDATFGGLEREAFWRFDANYIPAMRAPDASPEP